MIRCFYHDLNTGARLLGVLPAAHANRKHSDCERAVIVVDGETDARVVYLTQLSFDRELTVGGIP